MATESDFIAGNVDQVIDKLVRAEKAAGTAIIRDIRKRLRAVMRSKLPGAKAVTPDKSGDARKSVKVKSYTRRGTSGVSVQWTIQRPTPTKKDQEKTLNYIQYPEFKTKGNKARGFGFEEWEKQKESIEKEAVQVIKTSFESALERLGIKVI